jgi:hypothetical protein
MENTATLNKLKWDKEKILTPLLVIMFIETIVLLYTIYSIPAVC